MITDIIEESGVEVIFSYSPAWEMFFSMHVLSGPDHHISRRKWRRAAEKKHPELAERIRNLQDITIGWTILIDTPVWDKLRQMEIPELFTFLRRKNIYEWNEMIQPLGKQMSIEERNQVLDTSSEYLSLIHI